MKIDNFLGREKAQEIYEKIHNFDYFDAYYHSFITKEEYDKVNDELDKVKYRIFVELKKFDDKQKNK
jgi:hypothetical protein